MPDPKRSSSIFNFSKKQLLFLRYCIWFFIPVVIVYAILEVLVVAIPLNYKIIGEYLKTDKNDIEVIALGSSQMKTAFNPALSNIPSINFASTSQHHKEDFNILKQTRERFPKLKYVLLELSYNHLELPYHPNDYWKNNVYLKFYDVNAFERPTYFKDRLIYLSNPRFYSIKMMDYYFYKHDKSQLNRYGFDTNNYNGAFKKLDYNESKIASRKFRIHTNENLDVYETNTSFLFSMLDYMKDEQLQVIICSIPMYKTFLQKRNPNLVHRRDSILNIITKKYSNVQLLNEEEDTINFKVKDFLNENHLNPDGAKKFTALVNEVIDDKN